MPEPTEQWERCYEYITVKVCRHIEHRHEPDGWYGLVVVIAATK